VLALAVWFERVVLPAAVRSEARTTVTPDAYTRLGWRVSSGKLRKNDGKIHGKLNGKMGIYMERSTIETMGKSWKIHYFDWVIFNSYFDITRGYDLWEINGNIQDLSL